MLEYLFGSKTRLRLLQQMYRDPSRPYFVRELTREIGTQINAVRREITLLQKAGVIEGFNKEGGDTTNDDTPGSQLRKYYRLNKQSPIYPELQALLLKEKFLGEQELIHEMKQKAGDVKLFLLTGLFTKDKNAPTDILMVGNIKTTVVAKLVSEHEKESGKGIRYTFMSEREFTDRQNVMDRFLFSIFEAKHLKVVDELTP